MRKTLIMGVLLGALAALQAQTAPLNDFLFSLWPEYDHPGVLVLFSGEIDSTSLPQSLAFRVPDNATRVLATGVSDTSDQLLPVVVEERGAEKWVRLNLVRPDFQVEFYYNPFGEDHSRSIAYELEFDTAIPAYLLAIQKPIMAENFTLPVEDMESFQDQHGLTFYRKQMPGMAANTVRKFEFQYENHSGETSIQQLQKMLQGQNPGMASTMDMPAPIVKRHRLPLAEPLIALAVVAIITAFLYTRQKKTSEQVPLSAAKSGKFCTECGQTLGANDKFCANCGTKVNAPNPV